MIGNNINLAIVDYGMGNLQSVLNAAEYVGGCNPLITDDPGVIRSANGLILPGVGAFEDAMKELKKRKLIDLLHNAVLVKKKPILGICLGMQLLFQESEENGIHKGLGWLDGTVKKFDIPLKFRIPHIGWNDIIINKDTPLLNHIESDKNFYFVHSFYAVTDEQYVIAKCNYGINFTAAVSKGNIYGTQFHPERSHMDGLSILKNYFNIIKASGIA